MSEIALIVVALVLGAAIGPVTRAQACRALADEGSGRPLSCPRCFSVLESGRLGRFGPSMLLSGRCPECAMCVGPPRGTVEVVGAAMLAVLAFTTENLLSLLAYGWVAAVGLALAVVDIAVHRLPNRVTGLLSLGAGVFLVLEAVTSQTWWTLATAVASGAAAALFYVGLSIATRGGVGVGDAKLAAGLAFVSGWTGWTTAAFAVTLGFVLTGLAAVAILLFTNASRKDSLPHGPFMVAATMAAIVSANV